MQRAESAGVALGLLAAVVFLVAAAVWLLGAEDTSVKVLVAVWLWALPVLGIGAGLGWLAGRGFTLLTRRSL